VDSKEKNVDENTLTMDQDYWNNNSNNNNITDDNDMGKNNNTPDFGITDFGRPNPAGTTTNSNDGTNVD